MTVIVTAISITPIELAHSQTETMQLIATGSGRAILQVNGERMVLSEQEPIHKNVILISADSERVVLDMDGRQIVLRTDDVAAPVLDEEYDPSSADNSPVVLWADSSGFFFAQGKVNGASTRFLVDTGADLVVFSQSRADDLGIDYQQGQNGYASTASGMTALKTIKLNQISIGNISIYNVQASVIPGRFPEIPLLGGSFLNNINMSRIGTRMTLRKR